MNEDLIEEKKPNKQINVGSSTEIWTYINLLGNMCATLSHTLPIC